VRWVSPTLSLARGNPQVLWDRSEPAGTPLVHFWNGVGDDIVEQLAGSRTVALHKLGGRVGRAKPRRVRTAAEWETGDDRWSSRDVNAMRRERLGHRITYGKFQKVFDAFDRLC
jgi:hypothetical protein